METISPWPTSRLMSFKTFNVPKDLLTFRTEIMRGGLNCTSTAKVAHFTETFPGLFLIFKSEVLTVPANADVTVFLYAPFEDLPGEFVK